MGSLMLPLSSFSLPGNFEMVFQVAAAGSSVTLAADAATQGAMSDLLAEGAPAFSQVWKIPPLLQPRADVAKKLSSALAVAAALKQNRNGGDENRPALDTNGNGTETKISRSASTQRPSSPKSETLKALTFGPDGFFAPMGGGEPAPSKEELKKNWREIPWYLRWGSKDSFEYVLQHGNKNEKVLRCLGQLLKDIHELNFWSKITMFLTFRKVIEALATALELDFKVPLIGVVVRGDMDDRKWYWMDSEAVRTKQDFVKWFSAEFPKDVEIHIPLGIQPARGMIES